jgi:hypothetical protein
LSDEEKEFHSLTRMEQLGIAEKHIAQLNVQLAAAWRKGHADAQAPALERIEALHEQLAAEREFTHKLIDQVTSFREALAAERERHGDEMTSVQLQLNKQLAAEREKVRHWQERFDDKERQLYEMTNDRDRWRDMAHGGPTKRPAWDKR